jgi:hypothetical protein
LEPLMGIKFSEHSAVGGASLPQLFDQNGQKAEN